MLPELRVVCALIESHGKLLVAQRGPQMALPGKWEFPGGKVLPGETDSAALEREIKEELALEISVGEALSPVLQTQADFVLQLIPYRCRLLGGELLLAEHQACQWATARQLPYFDWCPADRPIVSEWLSFQTDPA